MLFTSDKIFFTHIITFAICTVKLKIFTWYTCISVGQFFAWNQYSMESIIFGGVDRYRKISDCLESILGGIDSGSVSKLRNKINDTFFIYKKKNKFIFLDTQIDILKIITMMK